MSHHAIEDLIEETTHLIDKSDLPASEKRNHLAALFGIQHFYDTGYIHFRIIEILLKYKFVYRIPLASYPGFKDKKVSAPGWMEDQDSGELAYAQSEDGSIFLYIDAGHISWQILCEKGILSGDDCAPVAEIALPAFLESILDQSEKQNQQTLLTQWYGLLVNAYLDSTFGEAEGFPESFDGLLKHVQLNKIRAIAQRNTIKRIRNEDEAIRLPTLADEVKFADTPDKEFTARFFLDLKKSNAALIIAFQKIKKAKLTAGGKADEYLDGRLAETVASSGWIKAGADQKDQWIWYKDVSTGRRFLWINYEEKDKFLMAHLGFQHKKLLQWQQREKDTTLSHLHFYQMAIVSLPEERQENKKFTNELGGWKFDITKPVKTLNAQIDHLAEDLCLAEENYFPYLDNEFPEIFLNRDPERLVHLLEEGEDDTGMVPEYTLFSSSYAILLVFVFYYREKKDNEKMKKMITLIEEKLTSRERRSAYETIYLEPFLDQIKANPDDTPLPLLQHYLLLTELMHQK